MNLCRVIDYKLADVEHGLETVLVATTAAVVLASVYRRAGWARLYRETGQYHLELSCLRLVLLNCIRLKHYWQSQGRNLQSIDTLFKTKCQEFLACANRYTGNPGKGFRAELQELQKSWEKGV